MAEAKGAAPPPANSLRFPSPVGPVIVMFKDTALALPGRPHVSRTLKVRTLPAPRAGPPRGPGLSRVSMMRQGGRVLNPAMRTTAVAAEPLSLEAFESAVDVVAVASLRIASGPA